MASSYYDKILESFDNPEAESIYDEGILDEGILDEDSYGEALFNRRKRPVKVPASLGRPSNFGRNVSPSAAGNGQGGFVSKAELKRSLDSISEQVNDLKKSGVTLASSIKRLDDGYEKIVKGIARKDRSQDSFLSSSTMMTLLSTMANKPTLNPDALSIVRGASGGPERIEVKQGQDAVQVDMTKTMLFTMLPTLTSGGSSSDNNNAMMMMMMVLLLDKNRNTSGSSNNDNTLLLMMPMLMMNKK